jgi:VIT1/CCC1 family predicted Fe2+/Mn2+ transporter
MRNMGVNDGLVSTFLLVAGVAGGVLSPIDVLLMAISGTIAGAVSIFADEFVATTKSQNEVLRGKTALERRHIQTNRHDENV